MNTHTNMYRTVNSEHRLISEHKSDFIVVKKKQQQQQQQHRRLLFFTHMHKHTFLITYCLLTTSLMYVFLLLFTLFFSITFSLSLSLSSLSVCVVICWLDQNVSKVLRDDVWTRNIVNILMSCIMARARYVANFRETLKNCYISKTRKES